MEWPEVLQRIEAGESEETEFKRGLGDWSAIGRAVCAFANTEGGVVILGVTDSQSILGVNEDAEEVQERLATFLRTGCSVPVNGQCGRHEDPNGWVHWIEGRPPGRPGTVALRRPRVGAARMQQRGTVAVRTAGTLQHVRQALLGQPPIVPLPSPASPRSTD